MQAKKKNQTYKQNTSHATARDVEFEADVLFQRIYDKWYAFTMVDEECLMTEVNPRDVQRRMKRSTRES